MSMTKLGPIELEKLDGKIVQVVYNPEAKAEYPDGWLGRVVYLATQSKEEVHLGYPHERLAFVRFGRHFQVYNSFLRKMANVTREEKEVGIGMEVPTWRLRAVDTTELEALSATQVAQL